MARRPRLLTARAAAAVARRPRLWPVAASVGWRFLAPGWWRRFPPLPRPPAAYLAMRHQTMWGDEPGAALSAEELVAYLRWCARMRDLAR